MSVNQLVYAITSPRGIRAVTADAVVLATGARERPRPARLVPGDRPDGVYTTGQLQNLVHLHHAQVGSRAVIVGGELVSWSAVLTLRESGCATVGMVTGYPRAEAYTAFRVPGRFLMDGPVFTRSRLVGIHGKDRVRSAVVENIDSGKRTTVDCDSVVFTSPCRSCEVAQTSDQPPKLYSGRPLLAPYFSCRNAVSRMLDRQQLVDHRGQLPGRPAFMHGDDVLVARHR